MQIGKPLQTMSLVADTGSDLDGRRKAKDTKAKQRAAESYVYPGVSEFHEACSSHEDWPNEKQEEHVRACCCGNI